ncbi:unnamed protein product [Sympodiomycopsis kandeliae]
MLLQSFSVLTLVILLLGPFSGIALPLSTHLQSKGQSQMNGLTFTTNSQLNADTNAKDVGYLLGTTVNDDDPVVFTKTSLLQFLKLHGIQVDTNYSELKRLPKYATFGKFDKGSGATEPAAEDTTRTNVEPAQHKPAVASATSDFKPTRRVREDIGGGSAQITALFGAEESTSSGQSRNDPGHRRDVDHPIYQTLQGRPNGDPPGSTGDPTHPIVVGGRSVDQTLEKRPNGKAPPSEPDPIHGRDLDHPIQQTLHGRPKGPLKPSEPDPIHPPTSRNVDRAADGQLDEDCPSQRRDPDHPIYQTLPEPRRGKAPPSCPDPIHSSGAFEDAATKIRPSRRVREAIGGGSEQISSLFGGDTEQENVPLRRKRGTFIVVEGLDRAGKSTQVDLLADRLKQSEGQDRVRIRKFPDRTTPLGQVLNTYLTSSTVSLHPRAAHLLFSANRWELSKSILEDLNAGITTIADRYVASGIAYSLVKELPLDWLIQPDRSLPSPDVTIFLNISADQAAKRGGYGNERYEKEEIQAKVRSAFTRVEKIFNGEILVTQQVSKRGQKSGEWIIVDAGREKEQVWNDVWNYAERVDQLVKTSGKEIDTLFEL